MFFCASVHVPFYILGARVIHAVADGAAICTNMLVDMADEKGRHRLYVQVVSKTGEKSGFPLQNEHLSP